MLGGNDLENYYKTMHLLRYEFKYSTESIESMMPWELEVELSFIVASMKKEVTARQNSMN